MEKAIDKLVKISGAPLSSRAVSIKLPDYISPNVESELRELLTAKNGFYAFEQALHVLPSQSMGESAGLDTWNAPQLWISHYLGLADQCFFFAEDVFGVQFCIRSDGIFSFDPETGALDEIASTLSGWAKQILEKYELLTGYPLAHSWQIKNGRLDPGKRLVPKQPFVTGGAFTVENLYALEALAGMRMRANLATQIRDLPDGAAITWKIVD